MSIYTKYSIILGFILKFTVSIAQQSPTQPAYDTKKFYTKTEQRITMRDGKKLYTVIYAPKDQSRKYAILFNRTPYGVGPYEPDAYKPYLGPSEQLMKAGYIFAYQDVRGRNLSEGEFVNMRPYIPNKKTKQDFDESTDAYDSVDWLVKNIANNNGNVGIWGISYGGFYASMALLDAHKAIKAVSPQAPIANWFIGDDFHHHGAFLTPHAFNFFSGFGLPRPVPEIQKLKGFNHGTPDGYKFFMQAGSAKQADSLHLHGQVSFWNDLIAHPDYDEYWKSRNTLPHFRNVKPAVLTVGGWFDAENLYGALHLYQSIETQSPKTDNFLVMGPWFHGGWARSDGDKLGNVHFGSKTSEYYRQNIEYPFFAWYLNSEGSAPKTEAWLFRTGSNQWEQASSWPEKPKPFRLYFQENGMLGFEPQTKPNIEFDEYISDPMRPVPHTNETTTDMTREMMTEDQRFASRRPDVLVYQTPELKENITLSGPITANIQLECSGTDADLVVKLIDVFPDTARNYPDNPAHIKMGGYQLPVRMEVMRTRYRNSYEKPEALTAGKPTLVKFALQDINHSFQKGHRIMVQVQSTWFPLLDRNPQQFVNTYTAKPSDYKKTIMRVHRGPETASYLEIYQSK